jgi:hypothetical protein
MTLCGMPDSGFVDMTSLSELSCRFPENKTMGDESLELTETGLAYEVRLD